MSQPYEKALGPDRPNEEQLGKAISPPPFQRCVPIYPLRYGGAECSWDKDLFPRLGTDGYPELAAGKAYGLRVLQPGANPYLTAPGGKTADVVYLLSSETMLTHARLLSIEWLPDLIDEKLVAPVLEPQ